MVGLFQVRPEHFVMVAGEDVVHREVSKVMLYDEGTVQRHDAVSVVVDETPAPSVLVSQVAAPLDNRTGRLILAVHRFVIGICKEKGFVTQTANIEVIHPIVAIRLDCVGEQAKHRPPRRQRFLQIWFPDWPIAATVGSYCSSGSANWSSRQGKVARSQDLRPLCLSRKRPSRRTERSYQLRCKTP